MQRQSRIDQAVRAYAEAVAGSSEDLNPALEAASLELLEHEIGRLSADQIREVEQGLRIAMGMA